MTVTQQFETCMETDSILWEVLQYMQPYRQTGNHLSLPRADQMRRLRPLLAYACRLHWRAGRTEEGDAALKRFVYRFLSGDIPYYD